MTIETDRVLDAIRRRREEQRARWGVQALPDGTGPDTIPFEFYEGVVELLDADELLWNAERDCDDAVERGAVTWRHVFVEEVFEVLAARTPTELRGELLDTAGVVVQWLEALHALDAQGSGAGGAAA
jgi:hypothetical protein